MGQDWPTWDSDLDAIMNHWDSFVRGTPLGLSRNPWFSNTAQRMAQCHLAHKEGDREQARHLASLVEAPDWRLAAHMWLDPR